MKLHEVPIQLLDMPYKEAKRYLEDNGFKVITPFQAKENYLELVKDKETSHKVNLFSRNSAHKQKGIEGIVDAMEKIVLKDTRWENGSRTATSFETLKSYMDWRSKVYYTWLSN